MSKNIPALNLNNHGYRVSEEKELAGGNCSYNCSMMLMLLKRGSDRHVENAAEAAMGGS